MDREAGELTSTLKRFLVLTLIREERGSQVLSQVTLHLIEIKAWDGERSRMEYGFPQLKTKNDICVDCQWCPLRSSLFVFVFTSRAIQTQGSQANCEVGWLVPIEG